MTNTTKAAVTEMVNGMLDAHEEVDMSTLSLEELGRFKGMSFRDVQSFHETIGEMLCHYLSDRQIGKLVQAIRANEDAIENNMPLDQPESEEQRRAISEADDKLRNLVATMIVVASMEAEPDGDDLSFEIEGAQGQTVN